MHLRAGGDSDVYAVALNTFDFPVNAEDWLDKTLLATADITAIEGSNCKLEKQSTAMDQGENYS